MQMLGSWYQHATSDQSTDINSVMMDITEGENDAVMFTLGGAKYVSRPIIGSDANTELIRSLCSTCFRCIRCFSPSPPPPPALETGRDLVMLTACVSPCL